MTLQIRTLRNWLLSCGAAAVLTGCASFERPKMDMASVWQGAPEATDQNPDSAFTPDAMWWTHFKNDEITEFVGAARNQNYGLRAAVDRILQSEAQARNAGSLLFPSLGAGLSASKNVRQVSGAPDLTTTNYQGTLTASYQLDLFGQVRNSAWAASQRAQSSQFDRQTVDITLVSNVITTYLQVLSARERMALTSERLNNAEEILKVLEAQRRVGALSDLELAQQRSALATQRAALPALRLAEQQSLHALAVLLGRNPEGFDVKGKTLSEVVLPVVAAGIPSTILERRPDVRRAESDLKAANYDVATAVANRFPSIQLTASGGTASSALANLFNAGTLFYSLAGSVAETLFAGGKLDAQEQLARGRYRELVENYRQAVLQAFSDVENALSAVAQNGEQFTYAFEASAQADEAYRLAALRYRSGTVDFQTVLNAQNAAFSAQEAEVQAELSRFTAVVGLTQALGGGWDGMVPAEVPLHTVYDPA